MQNGQVLSLRKGNLETLKHSLDRHMKLAHLENICFNAKQNNTCKVVDYKKIKKIKMQKYIKQYFLLVNKVQ